MKKMIVLLSVLVGTLVLASCSCNAPVNQEPAPVVHNDYKGEVK